MATLDFNEAWFYSGVRGAKDGRYTCYCPTPAKKASVLFYGATVTYSLTQSTNPDGTRKGNGAEQVTPFNINQREFIVKFNRTNVYEQQAFLQSNYFVIHLGDTGLYYFYFIDYIEPYQQLQTESNAYVTDPLEAFPQGLCYRVGITLDIWQTYYFKMRSKAITQYTQIQSCAPHDTANSPTYNEIITPSRDFSLIERTNMHSVINYIANSPRHIRPLRVPKIYTQLNTQMRRVLVFTPAESIPAVILKMSLTSTDGTKSGTYWVYINAIGANNGSDIRFVLNNSFNGNAINWLNTILTSTGKIESYYNDNAVGLSFPANSNYQIEEAYYMPQPLANSLFGTFATNRRDYLKLVPTNYTPPAGFAPFRGYILPVLNLAQGMESESLTPSSVYMDTRRAKIDYNTLAAYLQKVIPTLTPIEQMLPYLTIGTENQRIAVAPTLTGSAQQVDGNSITDYVTPIAEFEPTQIMFWVEGRLSPYGFKMVLSNGLEEVDLTTEFKLPLRNVSDSEEIERQKQSYELNNISKGIGLLSSGVGFAGSVATGNVVGAVMSAAQIAGQGISLFDSVANAPDFSKRMRSSLADNGNNFTAPIIGVYIEIPTQFSTNQLSLALTYSEEYTEIGIEIGCILRNNFDMDNSNVQKTGFIQMGCILKNIQHEAGEVLERRLREGVNFWYV